jgi:diaminopropionate ammonia-lyase
VRAFVNPAVRRDEEFRGLFADEEYRDVHEYYAAHPELPPTPLRSRPDLAAALAIHSVAIKDESHRFGLESFKITGVRYAVHRLGDRAAGNGLVCATAGNHGRAVARVARDKRVPCTVFVPKAAEGIDARELGTRVARLSAMREDGARVIEVDGSYEEAVRRASEHGRGTGATVVSDTSWPGYDAIPRWIMAGYTQIFEESFVAWDRTPDVVLVQGGVGGLVCAAASWFAWRFGAKRPFLIACEPDEAACLLASARAGRLTTIEGPLRTVLAGLRCAAPSPVAWPAIASGIDAFVSLPDGLVVETIDRLMQGDTAIAAGPSGACGTGALTALATAPELTTVRSACRLNGATRALVIVTEGP